MEEIVNQWIINMLDEAIGEAKTAISNERIWQNGATDDEAITTHEFNIICNEHFIEQLEEMKTAYTK
jgi:hypothetical protein